MAIDCDPNALAALAKCFKCDSTKTLLEIQTYLLCQILNAGGTGGGGTSVLPTNQIFVGNAANVATAVPMSKDATIVSSGALTLANTATARSDIGLGTTDTPQFTRLGLGLAASATMALTCLIPGAIGDQEVARFETTAGDPYFTIGQPALNNGGFFEYQRSANLIRFGIHGTANLMTIDNTAKVQCAGGFQTPADIFTSLGNINAGVGIYICQANNGISQTFDIGLGNTQIQFVGGIAVAIA